MMCKSTCQACNPKPKARMPWDKATHLTRMSDGRVVLRGSQEEAEHKYGELTR
jgi:hypothetical protein